MRKRSPRIIRKTCKRAAVSNKELIARASKKTIRGVAAALNKVLGSGAVHVGGRSDRGTPRFFIPSQSDDINELIGGRGPNGPGYPGGRIIECFGGEQTVKTGLGYDFLAGVQQQGGIAIVLPTEGNVDEWLAERYGINTDEWLTPPVTTVEDVDATILSTLARVGKRQLVGFLWDSVAGTTTEAELEEENLTQSRAAQIRALLLSKMFRRFGATFPEHDAILFCINQVRENPDAMFGKKTKPPGGKAIPFYSALRMELTMTGQVKRQRAGKKRTTGFKIKIQTVKNRNAPPFQETEVICDFSHGIIPVPKKRR